MNYDLLMRHNFLNKKMVLIGLSHPLLFQHCATTVNHSRNFLNPADPDIHTQNIERLWRSAKRRNKIQNGTHRHLREYIDEFLFRRLANINNISVFDAILNGISTFMPPF